MIRLGLVWIGLLVLVLLEAMAALMHVGWAAFVATPFMVLGVAAMFMHVTSASALSRIFAVIGLFWITILLGIGVIDYTVRNQTSVTRLSTPYTAGGEG